MKKIVNFFNKNGRENKIKEQKETNQKDELVLTSILDAEKIRIFSNEEIEKLPNNYRNELLDAALSDIDRDKKNINHKRKKIIISSTIIWGIFGAIIAILVIILLYMFVWDLSHIKK
ncbi:hypothetical protein [Mycoplasmopsis columbina]|uniref:Uncharacterized protein n=1 Tax=Mycoplasmopsis columbina SF7 TaxID=1037410 RepID=F9UJP9_9BACT|nr:hypothetical protein [Mycoplasmopsis columbina]EGV00430.1 hypothetical protein MCSF7_00491 [Mycoplasmopsis columbina SF7]VEU76705.1 Uncharacterised protein [Mycoplasmopsis columbina]